MNFNTYFTIDMAPKRRKGLDEEAKCYEPDDDESSDEDSSSSMDRFIVDSDEPEFEDDNGDDNVLGPEDDDGHVIQEDPLPAAAAAATASQKKRGPGRPRGSTVVKKPPPLKKPGDSTYPCNSFSLTITKTGEDVGAEAIDIVASFIEEHCIKGGVSTEVGLRAHNLHLQGILKINWPATKEFVQILQKKIRALLPNGGAKYKVNLKLFAKAQTWGAMVGYITKDQGIYYLFIVRVQYKCVS